jgi:hypothetical protein
MLVSEKIHPSALVAESALAGAAGLRAEWRATFSPSGVVEHPGRTCWIGARDIIRNMAGFEKMTALLEEFACPPEVIAQQRRISLLSLAQGICPSWNSPENRMLHLHYWDAGRKQERKESYLWNQAGLVCKYFYRVLPGDTLQPTSGAAIHPQLGELADRLYRPGNVTGHPVARVRYAAGKPDQVEMEFTDCPTLERIAGNSPVSGIDFGEYLGYQFREASLTCSEASEAAVTVNFCVPDTASRY